MKFWCQWKGRDFFIFLSHRSFSPDVLFFDKDLLLKCMTLLWLHVHVEWHRMTPNAFIIIIIFIDCHLRHRKACSKLEPSHRCGVYPLAVSSLVILIVLVLKHAWRQTWHIGTRMEWIYLYKFDLVVLRLNIYANFDMVRDVRFSVRTKKNSERERKKREKRRITMVTCALRDFVRHAVRVCLCVCVWYSRCIDGSIDNKKHEFLVYKSTLFLFLHTFSFDSCVLFFFFSLFYLFLSLFFTSLE